MDAGHITILVLLDLSSGFDCVSHSILLEVLGNLGVSGDAFAWVKGYLQGRKQCTMVNGSRSQLQPVTSGVPQGSVLGPVLFSLYMLGIGEVVEAHHVNYVLYADDLQLFISTPPGSLHQAVSNLETCIASLFSWFVARRLSLNAAKTEVLLLGTKTRLQNVNFPGSCVGGIQVAASPTARDLGVILDSTLSMEAQVNQIRKDVFGRQRNIARVRKFLTPPHCSLVVKSLVLSHFNYCAVLLAGIDSTLLTKLQSALNATISRILTPFRPPRRRQESTTTRKSPACATAGLL